MISPRLIRSSLWNLLGYVLPLLAGLYAFPILNRTMGQDRFGLMTLIWAMVGYFNLFDLGIGRAITLMISRKLGGGDCQSIPAIYRSGTLFLLLIGCVGGVVFGLFAPKLLAHVIKAPPAMRDEFYQSVRLVGFCMPLITLSAAPRGLLEAYGEFARLTLLRVPFGVLTFLVPIWFPSVINNLAWVTFELVVLRGIWLVLHILVAHRFAGKVQVGKGFSWRSVRELMVFGGWMTASNIIGPILSTVDRFFIGTISSAAAIAYYTTPFEVISRLVILPNSLSSVLFPELGKGLVEDRCRAVQTYRNAQRLLWIILFVACLFIAAFGFRLLQWWMGEAFAAEAFWVMLLLNVGVFFNGFAYLPYVALHSSGRPRTTGIIHIIELIFFVPALCLLIRYFGVLGAAMAWLGRAALDLIALEYCANHAIRSNVPVMEVICVALASIALFGLPLVTSQAVRGGLFLMGIVGALLVLGVGWRPMKCPVPDQI